KYCNQVQAPPTRLQLLPDIFKQCNNFPNIIHQGGHVTGFIFLQVPAMTGSVHPRNLEDPLLLQTIYIVYIILKLQCVCVCVCNNTHFVKPFQSWNLTGFDLFL
uniref:Uncharacterized protein n=1 Tax=Oreochromis aureus TaxID=47969 RepID=A0A668VNG4_OREAU